MGFCARRGIDPPWPVTRDSLEKFFALMAKAAYVPGSIVQYVGAVLRQQVLMHFTVEPDLLQRRKYLVQAAKREVVKRIACFLLRTWVCHVSWYS